MKCIICNAGENMITDCVFELPHCDMCAEKVHRGLQDLFGAV